MSLTLPGFPARFAALLTAAALLSSISSQVSSAVPETAMASPASTAVTAVTASTSVLDRRIQASSDDAEESPGGTVATSSKTLELVYVDRANQKVGLRFANAAIPARATVTKAYVQFRSAAAGTKTARLAISGQATDNALAFSSTNKISTRARTSASVTWWPPKWRVVDEQGVNQRTPDLSRVVQEIVNRPGWTAGNALALIITGTGVRTAHAYDGSPTGAPLLHVEYLLPNQSPAVNAGPDRVVVLPAVAFLDGAVSDDGLPSGQLTTTWSTVSGPSAVVFGNPSAADTTVSLPVAGTYVLRLTADDGAAVAYDEVLVVAGAAPPPTGSACTGPWCGAFDLGGVPHGANGLPCGTGEEDGPDAPEDEYSSVQEMGNTACTNEVAYVADHLRTPASVRSLRILMGAGQQREELVSKFGWTPDDRGSVDLWYGFSIFYDNDWNLMGGLSQEVSATKWHVPLAFRIDGPNGSLNFSGDMNMSNGNGSPYVSFSQPHMILRRNSALNANGFYTDGLGLDKLDLGPIVTNSWMDFVCHIRWSTTTTNALRECWRDGEYKGAKTSLNAVGELEHHLRVGQYQTTTIQHPRTSYYDNVRIGTSYMAVDPSK